MSMDKNSSQNSLEEIINSIGMGDLTAAANELCEPDLFRKFVLQNVSEGGQERFVKWWEQRKQMEKEEFNQKYIDFITTRDEKNLFDIAKNYLEPMYIKGLLFKLNTEAKKEILKNFNAND
jgi:hypothetical protein